MNLKNLKYSVNKAPLTFLNISFGEHMNFKRSNPLGYIPRTGTVGHWRRSQGLVDTASFSDLYHYTFPLAMNEFPLAINEIHILAYSWYCKPFKY